MACAAVLLIFAGIRTVKGWRQSAPQAVSLPSVPAPSLDASPTLTPTQPAATQFPLPDSLAAAPLRIAWTELAEGGKLRVSRGESSITIPFGAFGPSHYKPPDSESGPMEIGRFFVARHKITPVEWALIMGKLASSADAPRELHPAAVLTGISWNEAQKVASLVSGVLAGTAVRARLPWQWEWEALATSSLGATYPDLIGPVGEWTGDAWNEVCRKYPKLGEAGDPGRQSDRVYRGVLSESRGVLSESRLYYATHTPFHEDSSRRLFDCGFRLCIVPAEISAKATPTP